MQRQHPTSLSRGEARIKRAFILSALIIAGLLAIALLALWLTSGEDAPAPVDDAEIATPIVPAPAGLVTNAGAGTDANANNAAPGLGIPPKLPFTDITEQAGIDFVHVNGAYGDRLMPETIGSGAAFFDYDRDGDQDLFLVNSREWSDHQTLDEPPTQALYRNDGSGQFEDVTAEAGLAISTYGMGVAIGDIDGDGWEDLYLTTLNSNRLFRNVEGRFEEITEQAGVGGGQDSWSSSAAFFDYDGDGDLDLFVVNYVDWSPTIDLEIDFRLTGLGRAYGAPLNFVGTNNLLYRNDGDGRFTDVSAAAGIQRFDPVSRMPVGKGLGLVPFDVDGDGWLDLIVVNDTVRNFLFRNRGDGSFEETAIFEGVAYDRNGKATSAMGVDVARFSDGELSIAVGNFANEMASLFMTTNGKPPFVDEAVIQGLGPASRIPLTFGVLFVDVDLDGREDLLLANGHLEHEIHKVQQSQHYAQPASLFWNCGPDCPRRFVPLPQEQAAVGDLAQDLVGRGAAYADIDGDGDLDLLITQNGRRPALLRNDQETGHHWLRVELIGQPPNRAAIGASVVLTLRSTPNSVTEAHQERQEERQEERREKEQEKVRRELRPTRSYLSQVERPITFGLGAIDDPSALTLTITWPDGREQSLVPEQIDRLIRIEQPKPLS